MVALAKQAVAKQDVEQLKADLAAARLRATDIVSMVEQSPRMKPTGNERPDLVVVSELFNDLHQQPAYSLAIEALLSGLDWERANSVIVARAFAVLMEDPMLAPVIAAKARREHRDVCACCRAKHQNEAISTHRASEAK